MTLAQSNAPKALPATLRQMIAVLEKERQALASLDADGLFEASRDKDALCDALAPENFSSSGPYCVSSNSPVRGCIHGNTAMRNVDEP